VKTKMMRAAVVLAAAILVPACGDGGGGGSPPGPNPGVLRFATVGYGVIENGGSAGILIVREGGSAGEVSVSFSTTPGTATPGQDYLPADAVVVFGDGETEKLVPVLVVDDISVEADETVLLALLAPTGGSTLGDPSTAVLTIVDQDVHVFFTTPAAQVDENPLSVLCTVGRIGDLSGTVSVGVVTGWGTAAPGQDYAPLMTVLTFAPGETSKTAFVGILEDTDVEDVETIDVGLFLLTPGVVATTPVMTISIVDDDGADRIMLIRSAVSVREDAGPAMIGVVRLGNASAAASVNFVTAAGSATAGADYGAVSGTLVFPAGSWGPQFIAVPIVDDALLEDEETFSVVLGGAVDATVGGPPSAAVKIIDNDKTFFQFDPWKYIVSERGLYVLATVRLTGAISAPGEVSYATKAGSATPGEDYVHVSGTLTFAAGENVKTFVIPILDDSIVEPTEDFTADLLAPMGGAVLPSGGSMTVCILDDDQGHP